MRKAIIYMILSAIFFTMVNSAIRYVDHLATMQLVFFRAIGTVLFCRIILIRQGIPAMGNNRKLLILRAVVGVTSLSVFYKVIQMMPIASALTLRYMSPFFAAGMAIFFLGEKMKRIQWLFFATAFMGVMILKGFDSRISLIGLLLGMTTALFSGMVYVSIRALGKSEHPVVIINYFMTLALVVGGIWSIFTWVEPIGIDWVILFSLGIIGFFAQLYMTKGLQSAESNLITPFKYAEVIFTIVVAWVFFGEYQTWITIGGMSLIILSLLANVYSKRN